MRSIPQDGGAPSGLAHESRDADAFDVVTIVDATLQGDLGLRIAGECRIQAEDGYRTGLLHIESERRRSAPSPDLQRCIREGIVEVVDLSNPGSGVTAEVLPAIWVLVGAAVVAVLAASASFGVERPPLPRVVVPPPPAPVQPVEAFPTAPPPAPPLLQ